MGIAMDLVQPLAMPHYSLLSSSMSPLCEPTAAKLSDDFVSVGWEELLLSFNGIGPGFISERVVSSRSKSSVPSPE